MSATLTDVLHHTNGTETLVHYRRVKNLGRYRRGWLLLGPTQLMSYHGNPKRVEIREDEQGERAIKFFGWHKEG